MDYKTSGVNVEEGRAFVNRIRSSVESTFRPEVIGGFGGFGGSIRLPKGFSNPVLVAGTDGVGTKLEIAQKYQAHFGVGLDLVAMCVNDVITSAAQPLFFLDYIATGRLGPEAMTEVIEGIAQGCKQSGCVLLGGETAEMPGFYSEGKYDLAGFCVAVAEESELVDGQEMKPDDQIIGIASSGVHSNGFSLVRKILDINNVDKKTVYGRDSKFLVEDLLKPTNIYVDTVKELLRKKIPLTGMAHITGGGLPENLPRCIRSGLRAVIDPNSWERPELFQWLQDHGAIPESDIWNTFNLGVGYCLVVPSAAVNSALDICSQNGFEAFLMGRVEENTASEDDGLGGLPF